LGVRREQVVDEHVLAKTSDKLLVVGAGPVGLAMAAALRAHDIGYDHVDASDGIGGNWRHGVYATVHTVSSKQTTAFADYPMPDRYPDFPSRDQMLEYLLDYARHKHLIDTIELNREVLYTHPNRDESWSVWFHGGERCVYKGLIVCSGHHWHKRYPCIPGDFAGQLRHSKDYKVPEEIAGQRVLVIGGGNSACDLACEAARVSISSDISLRRGYWFLPKLAFGRPLTDLPIGSLPAWAQRLLIRALIKVQIGDYGAYGLQAPDHRLFARHPTYGADLLTYIKQGRIQPRPRAVNIEGKRVTFADGACAEYDVILAATGYHNSVPFLPKDLIVSENETLRLFGGAFPDCVKNLYIVGAFQPRNGFGSLITPAADLYARLIRLQDDLEHPIGYILHWSGDAAPTSQVIDHYKALRAIRRAQRLLPILRVYDRWLSWTKARAPATVEPDARAIAERLSARNEGA
jgi:hypothetical protein